MECAVLGRAFLFEQLIQRGAQRIYGQLTGMMAGRGNASQVFLQILRRKLLGFGDASA